MRFKIPHPIYLSALLGLLVTLASWRLFGCGGAEFASSVIVRVGYWFVVGLSAVAAFSLYCCARQVLQSRGWFQGMFLQIVQRHTAALVLIGVLSTMLHMHEPHRFRTMNDEYALLSTSQMAHEYKTVAIPSRMVYFDNQPVYIGQVSDVRLSLYPVWVSFLHDLTGYRPANAFVLNVLLTPLFLGLLYALANLVGGSRRLGVLAVLLAYSVPLLAQVATSGGYDLLNITLIMALALVAFAYVKNATPEKQTLLIYSGLTLGYCRYESILYLTVVTFLVGRNWLQHREVKLRLRDALSPVFLVLPICYNLYYTGLDSYQVPTGGEAGAFFSPKYFFGNLGEAVDYFFFHPVLNSSSLLVALLGLVAVVYFFAYLFTNLVKGTVSLFIVSYAPIICVVLSVLTLILFNYWGQLTDYQAVRFALPVFVGAIPLIVWFLKHNQLNGYGWLVLWLGLSVFYCVGWAIPAQVQHHTTNSMIPSFFREYSIDFAVKHGDERTLFISKAALGFIAHDRPAMTVTFADANPDRIIDGYHYGHYDSIFTDQILTYDRTLKAFTVNTSLGALGDDYKVETVQVKRYAPVMTFRIARVVAIRNSAGEWIDLKERPAPEFKTDIDKPLSLELFKHIP